MLRSLTSGDFSVADSVDTSWASAIDIQMPYNVERVMDLATDGDVTRVKALMDEFEGEKKGVNIPQDIQDWVKQRIVGIENGGV